MTFFAPRSRLTGTRDSRRSIPSCAQRSLIMFDTLAAPPSVKAGDECGHPFCPGAAAVYTRLLAAHTPIRPLLTPAGEDFVRNLLQASVVRDAVSGPPTPRWDAGSRCLWLGDRLLKVFR